MRQRFRGGNTPASVIASYVSRARVRPAPWRLVSNTQNARAAAFVAAIVAALANGDGDRVPRSIPQFSPRRPRLHASLGSFREIPAQVSV